jgi:hypothetical protein
MGRPSIGSAESNIGVLGAGRLDDGHTDVNAKAHARRTHVPVQKIGRRPEVTANFDDRIPLAQNVRDHSPVLGYSVSRDNHRLGLCNKRIKVDTWLLCTNAR